MNEQEQNPQHVIPVPPGQLFAGVFYDPVKMAVTLAVDLDRMKDWNFIASVLQAGVRVAETNMRLQVAASVQAQQQEQQRLHEIRRNLRAT